METETRGADELPLSQGQVLELFRNIEAGDSSALMRLYECTNRLLYGLILRILGHRASAEEALLDVYTQIWKQAASCPLHMEPFEWLVTLARRSALSRAHWDRREPEKQEASQAAGSPRLSVAPGQQDTARTALASLAPAQRELLEWAYSSGLGCSEMAAQLGKPVGAIRSHLRVGLSKIAESLGMADGLSPDPWSRNGGVK